MNWYLTFAVASGLALLAFPTLEKTPDPAMASMSAAAMPVGKPRDAWYGNAARRDDILISAVWGGKDFRAPRP